MVSFLLLLLLNANNNIRILKVDNPKPFVHKEVMNKEEELYNYFVNLKSILVKNLSQSVSIYNFRESGEPLEHRSPEAVRSL